MKPFCPFCHKKVLSLLKHLHLHADEAYEEEVAVRTKLARIEQVIKVQMKLEKLSLKK